MRTPFLAIAAALLIACEKTPTGTEHHITITREILEDDKLLYTATIWQMSVDDYAIYFTRSDIDPQAIISGSRKLGDQIHQLKLSGSDGKAAASVFASFTQWTATAKENHVEPFSKRIAPDCTYSF